MKLANLCADVAMSGPGDRCRLGDGMTVASPRGAIFHGPMPEAGVVAASLVGTGVVTCALPDRRGR
jgi:hypothetical protein